MRRIAITLTVLALVAGAFGCSSDAPTPPKAGGPGGPGPTGSGALQIRLFTSNPNPSAGTCTLIQAVVTLNGSPVADGTSVAFSTDFGVFAQNALPLISVVTQNGTAVTALCSDFPGNAVVRATSTVGSETASATITIAFQTAPAGAGPFVSFCDPSFGPSTGGTQVTIRGGRFCGNRACTANDLAGTRVVFIANGIAREATVTSLTGDTITILTPGFPEITSPSQPVEIRVTLNAGAVTPITLTLPNCFAFGTTLPSTPTITAVLPSSGVNEGNTRVTIIGSGFQAPVQVFFGDVEATVVSVFFNQIVALTPPAFGAGRDNLNQQVDVRVRNVTSGLEAVLEDGFRYVQPLQLISISNNEQRVDRPFTPVTIFGHGFQSPVAVTLAGRAATVISVAESELVVLPSRPIVTSCGDISGGVQVTNINTGDSASGLSFTYLVAITRPVVSLISPTEGGVGTVVTITGTNLPLTPEDADVRFGIRQATVTASSPTSMTVIAPENFITTPPLCPMGVTPGTPVTTQAVNVTVTNILTNCTATAPDQFEYQLPCVVATPTPTLTPTLTPTATTTPTTTTTPTPTPVLADLALSKGDSADPVAPGAPLTYTLIVSNFGPNAAAGVVVSDSLPAGTTFASCISSQGTCSGPPVGTGGPVLVSASLGTLAAPGLATVTITVNVTAASGSTLTNTAFVSSSTADPVLGNNSDTENTAVMTPP